MEPNAQAFAEPPSSIPPGHPKRKQIPLVIVLSLAVLVTAYFASRINGLSWLVTGVGLTLGILEWLLPSFVVKAPPSGKFKDFFEFIKKRTFPIYTVIVILLLLANGALYYIKSPGSSPTVTITLPQEGSHVATNVVVEGTESGIPQNEQLWLLVAPAATVGYFPQNGPVVVSVDGSWTASAALGGNDLTAVGRQFVLYTALIGQNDKEAQDALSKYFNNGKQTGSYLPIYPLPKGVQLISQVTVTRTV